jgi:hypothetical protein
VSGGQECTDFCYWGHPEVFSGKSGKIVGRVRLGTAAENEWGYIVVDGAAADFAVSRDPNVREKSDWFRYVNAPQSARRCG